MFKRVLIFRTDGSYYYEEQEVIEEVLDEAPEAELSESADE